MTHTACSLVSSAKKRCKPADFSALPLLSAEPKPCALAIDKSFFTAAPAKISRLCRSTSGRRPQRPPPAPASATRAVLSRAPAGTAGRCLSGALGERLGQHSAQRATLAIGQQDKTPGQPLPVVGRNGHRVKHGQNCAWSGSAATRSFG